MRDTAKQIEIMNRQMAYEIERTRYSDILQALARSNATNGIPMPSVEEADEARVAMMRAKFAIEVARGDLKTSSNYLHAVPLSPDFIEAEYWLVSSYGVDLGKPVRRVLDRTVTGNLDLWFNDDGYSFLSFENDGDAEMFVLALEGGAG